jgi:hypothetical protein
LDILVPITFQKLLISFFHEKKLKLVHDHGSLIDRKLLFTDQFFAWLYKGVIVLNIEFLKKSRMLQSESMEYLDVDLTRDG